MTTALLLFLIKFVAVTGPLTWWWMHGGQEAYFDFFVWVARDILTSVGVVGFPPSAVRERFMNFVPFLGLMLATPALPLTKRLWGLCVGYLTIFWAQIGLAWWASICFGAEGLTPEARMKFFPAEMLSDGMPLLLWVVFANEFVGQLLSRVFAPVAQAAAPPAKVGAIDRPPEPEPQRDAAPAAEANGAAREPPGRAGDEGAEGGVDPAQRSTGQKRP